MQLSAVRLRFLMAEKLVKFCVVGASGVAVNYAILWLLHDRYGFNLLIASPSAVEVSIFNNFFLNDFWTFRDRGLEMHLLSRLFRFNVISLGGMALTTGILYGLTHYAGMYYMVANLFGIAAGTAWNFSLNVLWTWRLKHPRS